MKSVGKTDVGKVREINEDCFIFGELDGAIYGAVCDGMGGADGGEIASSIAVATLKKQIENSYSPKMKPAAIQRLLESAVTAANIEIFKHAEQSGMSGMGTTVVVAIIKNGVAHIAFDGDSRAYLIGDEIRQLSDDHTYLRELYKLDKITEEEMLKDPRKNIITRALGVYNEIDVDYAEEDLAQGDILLLCSDGLTNSISDEGIFEICKTQDFENIPNVLLLKANENGGRDNITAVLLKNEEDCNG